MDAWSLAQMLVRIDSTDPGAYEGDLARAIESMVEANLTKLPGDIGRHISLERLEVLPDRSNLMVTVPGTGPDPRLVYICHMDTVVAGDGWSRETPPFGGVVHGDRLYGRGACDMKSGLACALSALFGLLEDIAMSGSLPQRGFSLICTVDEEDRMRGAETAIAAGWVGPREWVLDTEPTDGQIQVAHKGRTWFELTMTGVTAHASQPWEGADAIAAMAEAISSIRRSFASLPAHDELGPSTVTFGQIEGGYQPYVVPDSCTTWIDMRLAPPTDTRAACRIVTDAIEKAESSVPGAHGGFRITGDRSAVERDPNSPLLAALSDTVRATTGQPADIGFFTGYTDTAVIASTCSNRTCLSYGPGSLALAHKPNEYVPKADVMRVEAVLRALMRKTLWHTNCQTDTTF